MFQFTISMVFYSSLLFFESGIFEMCVDD